MKSNKIRLGEQCVVTSSKRFHLSERITQGVPFYCSKEIIKKFNGEDVTECDYISEDLYKKVSNEFGVPKENDLLITTRGTIGIPYLYKRTDRFYFADGNLTWIKDFDSNLYSKFLYYWFQSYEGRKKFEALAKGTAQKAVPISGIKTLEIELPSLKSQKRIADILSAYDDLIENNQKQIKLLEEAAQRLYKEWFVDLRFLGHENTKIVDGVPEGWKKNCAEKFFEITIGKTPPRTEKRCFTTGKNGIPWVSIADMGNSGMFVLNTAENLTDDAIKQYNVKVIPKNTVLLSFKLTVGRVAIAPNDICTNEAIAHFKGGRECEREYTYFYLKNFHYDELGSTSSISKAVNSKIIKAMPFIMPSEKLLKEYSSKTKDIFDLIICKQKIDNNLKITRDRILHKLMSGEVEV